MAAVALNTFKTIRSGITTNSVGIYTCPVGVASIILTVQVTNISTGSTTYNVSVYHSRSSETPSDYTFANNAYVPPNDSINLLPDGKMILETSDVIKVQANANNSLNVILSVLETAKS
jgi:hypothetical protein